MANEKLIRAVGTRASVAAAGATVLFAISLVIGLASRSDLAPLAGYVVCFFLAAGVVVMMAAVHCRTPEDRRLLSLLALAAAVMYAPLVMAVYFLQVTVTAANPLGLPPDVLRLVAFVPGSPLFALDMLGYAFLCLSTFAAAFTLTDPRDRPLRSLCIVHGALALPTLAAPVMSGLFRSGGGQANDIGSWVLLFWCALFTPIPLLFARYLRRPRPVPGIAGHPGEAL